MNPMRLPVAWLAPLLGLLLAGLLLPACARTAQPPLPEARDLRAVGAEAARAGVPVVLAVVAEHCPYCRVLEDEVLRPMQIAPEYREGVRLQVLDLDRDGPVIDFDGVPRSPQAIAGRYGVRVTPTVLILGPDGTELGERQVGISVIDYYWGYLDAAINEARAQIVARR